MFSSKIPLSNLVELCRVLRHSLGAGLTLRDVFRQQAERGAAAVRPVALRIRSALDQGESLEAALEEERHRFPPLFLALASVGEQTGQLPEIFGELEKYYALQQKLRRQLISQSFLPVVQLVIAFGVIAILIFVLGIIGQAHPGSKPPGILGFTGAAGSIVFLLLSFGTIGLLVGAYLILTRAFQQKPFFDALLLRIPVLGPCAEALVLGRFAVALQLTLETGMPIQRAMRLSLEATGNTAFAAHAGTVNEALKGGEDLTAAVSRCRLFPTEFINMIAVAEEGGRVPEMMRHQAEHYYEEAARRLTVLTKLLTFGIWLLYAIFMVIAIFRIANIYFSALGV
jgi:type II secretory pathway component PulF